jgi:hypothetical protein
VSASHPIVDIVHALAAVFTRLAVRWYVFGAQAATVWGSPRMSADLDVTAQIAPERAQQVVADLEAAGFHLRVDDVADFAARTRVLPLVHSVSGMPVDLVLSGPGLEERFHERAIPVDIGGVAIPFISPEDLIVTKVLAGRPKDLEDVRGVLRARSGVLDLGYIRSTLALLEEALAQSDLLPALETAVAAAGKRAPRD